MVREDLILEEDLLFPHRQSSARDRLLGILKNRTIYASPMPFLPTECRAVCFSECIWDGLTGLAAKYSPYGVVFSKRLIFDSGGGPALYLRGDALLATGDQIPPLLHPFIAPFDPEAVLKPGVRLDWLHEREWRVPASLSFGYADIQYVLVESIDDARSVVHEIGAQFLPESKLIPIDVSRTIQSAWKDR